MAEILVAKFQLNRFRPDRTSRVFFKMFNKQSSQFCILGVFETALSQKYSKNILESKCPKLANGFSTIMFPSSQVNENIHEYLYSRCNYFSKFMFSNLFLRPSLFIFIVIFSSTNFKVNVENAASCFKDNASGKTKIFT